jgi:hypothetical protein
MMAETIGWIGLGSIGASHGSSSAGRGKKSRD